MPKRVNRYETSDGLLLETLEDARAHEAWLELITFAKQMLRAEVNGLTLKEEPQICALWLRSNRDGLITLLKTAERHDAES